MYNKATNSCKWIMTKRHDRLYCGNNCVNEFCGEHNQLLRSGHVLATLCSLCHANGTRSITKLCIPCGGQIEITRICNREKYHRKKQEKQEAAKLTAVECCS